MVIKKFKKGVGITMNEKQAQQYLEPYYEEFLEWMTGQTVGINKDGSTEFYDWDVKRFWNSKWNKVKLK